MLNENSTNRPNELDMRLGNIFPKQFKFLIYVQEMKKIDKAAERAHHPISYIRPDIRFFEFFIIMNKVSIKLAARILFSPKLCGKFSLKLLNSFDIKTQKWKNKLNNFNHFDNFHGCLMTFFVEGGMNFYYDDYKSVNPLEIAIRDIKFHGLTHEILEKLTKDLNITGHYTLVDRFSGDKFLSGTKNFIGHFEIGSHFYSVGFIRTYTAVHYSHLVYTMEYYYLVTQNDLYTNYEKLLMPFDFTTWILLSVTISLAFGIIFASFSLPKWLQTLFHGVGMNDPAFKTLGVIFGISQLKLPQKTIYRFVLGLFLWFCLMFRTCYQSKLFEFMTSDMRKPLPASIEDLKEMNYTIVLHATYYNFNEKSNEDIINVREKPNIVSVSWIEFINLYEKSLKGENEMKFAFLVHDITHSLFNSTYKSSLQRMQNEKLQQMTGYMTNRNMLIQSQFDKLLEKLIPSGIAQHSVEYGKWFLFRPVDNEVEDSRKVLSMTDLEFGFVIWLVSISLPITCFLIEIYIGFCRKVKKTIEELEMFAITRIVEIVLEKLI
ncbi:hypothetical protein PVAND_017067 [Polypedilum vanderplanki]|uniref:Uncharacterized protein n=1 Tax=Polypedilum vanderplanki TaxID=319348 RepID=A0A9J6BH78_POLVA|nr:hypothetical protein PVAND_017067 [Polypedilum vanderplanki]